MQYSVYCIEFVTQIWLLGLLLSFESRKSDKTIFSRLMKFDILLFSLMDHCLVGFISCTFISL